MSDSLKMLLGVIVGYSLGKMLVPIIVPFWVKVKDILRGLK